MARTIGMHTARDNGQIRTIEERLLAVFPEGSFYLRNPEGTNARSDQGVDKFRLDWAKHQKTKPEAYKQKAGKIDTVRVSGRTSIRTIKKNIAESVGIPPAAIVLRKPDDTKLNESVQLSTFKGYWSK